MTLEPETLEECVFFNRIRQKSNVIKMRFELRAFNADGTRKARVEFVVLETVQETEQKTMMQRHPGMSSYTREVLKMAAIIALIFFMVGGVVRLIVWYVDYTKVQYKVGDQVLYKIYQGGAPIYRWEKYTLSDVQGDLIQFAGNPAYYDIDQITIQKVVQPVQAEKQ